MSPLRRRWLLLSGALLFLFACALGSRGLNEPDEGRYANIARAMVLGGDWWEPRMSGFGHYDKPPLIYWATAASLRVFGFNEWAARLPSLLGALLGLAGLGWAACRLYGERTAWWAVLICGTTAQFWLWGRIISPDMLLTGWCSLAVGAWAECRHRGGAWVWWALSLLFWTAAWWTKATPALVPLAGLTLGVWLAGDAAGRRALRPWLLLPGIILLGSPWYLSMLHSYPELRSFFFGRELAGRMAGNVDGRHGPLLYYVPVSLALWLPWWPLAAWAAWRLRSRSADARVPWRRRLGVEGWIAATGLIIFSLVASKLPSYTLTLAPWAALLFARALVARDFDARLAARIGGGFAVTVIACSLSIPPRYESSWKVNSSLRQVCAYLKQHGARRVEADHYWPGMEFYLGDETVRYVIRNKRPKSRKGEPARPVPAAELKPVQERASDTGVGPDRFLDARQWPGAAANQDGDYWLVRYRKQKGTPFRPPLLGGSSNGMPWVQIGHFELLRVTGRGEMVIPPNPLPSP